MTAALWLAMFAAYLRCMAGSFYFEDSPELLACAATLGNSHEPGYPLWVLAGRLALAVPVGGPAFRMNLLGAVSAALASVLLGRLASAMLRAWGRSAAVAAWSGAFVTVAWGFSDTFWWQAGIGDKYPALALGVAAVLWLSWQAAMRGTGPSLAVLALACGLAVAQHPFALFMTPAAAFALYFVLAGEPHRARILAIALVFAAIPLSTRVVYPPVRAVSDMDWGDPRTGERLLRYLTMARYRAAAPDGTDAVAAPRRTGVRLFSRLTREELGWGVLAAAPLGLTYAFLRSPAWALSVPWVVVLNLAFAVNTPVKVARWYGPGWAVTVLFAGLGLGWVAGWAGATRKAVAIAVIATALVGGWQSVRGAARNDLSRWYAAHDRARNILVSLPPGSIYLGRGDDDMFGLWAIRFAEGGRGDVEAVGMGSFVDMAPADAGGVRRVLVRYGLETRGWELLRWLVGAPPHPAAFFAKTGYDPVLWEVLDLGRHRARGLVARLPGRWDPAGSLAETLRAWRAMTWRGVRYARAGAVFDLARPRDELARDALLHNSFAFSTLGTQFLVYDGEKRAAEAAWAFGVARGLAEPLTGPLPGLRPGLSPLDRAIGERGAIAIGLNRLADIFASRDVMPVAVRYSSNAAALRVGVAGPETR